VAGCGGRGALQLYCTALQLTYLFDQHLTVKSCALLIPILCVQCESEDLQQCGRLWGRVASAGNRWSGEWGLQALAAAQRLELSLAGYADDMCSHTQVG
jgi:hypothetical protein